MSKRLPANRSTVSTTGLICVLLGFAAFLLSRGRDGFDKGLFLGMTVALMVLGAYLLGNSMRSRRDRGDEAQNETDGMWLPSRDDKS